jgi:putative transposase
MRQGYLYLVAIMDWYSRHVLAWELSNSMDTSFCLEALNWALALAKPEIFNTDQGSQFTSSEFTGRLQGAGIQISMDGRGRATDNIMIERLWRTVKYEDVYPQNYNDGIATRSGLRRYFGFYNTERPHQALGKRTPTEVYFGH